MDTEGKPRWYALWGLTSWLISDSASFNTMVESRRAPIRTIYWNDNALLGPMCRNMKIVIDPKSSFTNTEEIAMPPLALRSPGIDPESTFDTPRLSNTPTINMMVEGPCSPAQPNHDQNIPPHQQAKHGTSQEAPISSPKTSFALPSDSTAVVSSLTADICPSTTDITNIPSQAHTVSEEPRNAIPTGIDKVAELRRLMESRLEQNRNKLPSSKDQFIEGVLVTKKAAEKLHLLKIQVRLAEKGLQEAQEKQEILKVAKEKQSLTAQKYLDCQKDLEHLAKMQEEKMIGLRNLNLPSLDETLAASMNPIVQGVVNKYPEILGSYVHFQSETSS